jgi:polyisoprenyl-teichoic acid--peptidoglycan teichoic acid transferase
MTCAEARRLLDQGTIPGSARGRNPQLGFHLATCAGCRAYREQLDDQLLAQLVAAPGKESAPQHVLSQAATAVRQTPPPVAQSPASENPVSTQKLPQSSRRKPSLPVTVVAGAGLLVLFAAWYLGLPLYRAYNRDIKQWSVAAAPVSSDPPVLASATAAAAAPTPKATATPRSTATPQPTVTPSTIPTITPTPTPALPAAQPLTVLLLGIDARPGEGTRARSDALMLARIDPQRGDVALLSMPRDLWLNIPGYGENKVNSAFYQGELTQPNGGGMAAAKQTLSSAFNLPIDYAVVIDFAGFRSLIDALGGITVDVPKELYDARFPTDDYGYTVAHFLPGPQQMDGATALVFARTRHPDSDFERIKRQQLVLLGIAHKIRERGALQNLHEADQLTAALTPYIQTDMPPDLVLSMLWSIREIDPAKARRYTVDSSLLWETSVNGAYALVPQQGTLSALGQKLLTDSAP